MEKKVVEFYKFTKNFNENLLKRYIPNIVPFSKENQVNKITEAYCKNLIIILTNKQKEAVKK